MCGAHIFGNILQDAGLQRHVHIDSARHPAQLALADIQHSLNLLCLLAANFCIFPGCDGGLLNSWLNLGEPQEIYIGKLLLILSLLG